MKIFKIFNLVGDVDLNLEIRISEFINEALMTPDVPVLISINSHGGSTDSGFSIYNKLCALPNPLYTLNTGNANSIANIIFLAAPFERRFAFRNTGFFMHTARTSFRNGSMITPANMHNELRELTEINALIYSIISESTDISKSELDQIFIKQDGETKIFWDEFEANKIANIITNYDQIY